VANHDIDREEGHAFCFVGRAFWHSHLAIFVNHQVGTFFILLYLLSQFVVR
jgi:hypothetical protein